MKKYRIKTVKSHVVETDKYGCEYLYVIPKYKVQVQVLFAWVTIKSFVDMDTEYAKNCAEELLGSLKEGI